MERSTEAVRRRLLAVGAAVVSAFAVSRVKSFLEETVKLRLELDRYIQRLQTGTGSQQQANKEFGVAADLANELGLNLQATVKGYALLIGATRDQDAAARGANLTLDQTRELFESIVIAAAANKASVEDTNLILTAFSQILNKGKLSAEELRQQLGERLPGAQAIFAKALGVSTQQLDKMLSRGEILAVDVLPKVAKVLRTEFQDAATQAAAGPEAEFNRLQNRLVEVRGAFATGFIDEFSESAETLSDTLVRLSDDIEDLGEGLGSFVRKLAESTDINAKVRESFETLGLRSLGLSFEDITERLVSLRTRSQDFLADFRRLGGAIEEFPESAQSFLDAARDIEERYRELGVTADRSLTDAINKLEQFISTRRKEQLQSFASAIDSVGGSFTRLVPVVSQARTILSIALNEAAEREERLREAREESLRQLRKVARAEQDLAAEIRGSIKVVDERAERLVGAFRLVESQFKDGVIPPELVDEIRDRVEDILEAYARYGTEAP